MKRIAIVYPNLSTTGQSIDEYIQIPEIRSVRATKYK